MPEAPGSRHVVALGLFASAITLGMAAALMFAGIIPVEEESRAMFAAALGFAAFVDVIVAAWFFRKGQHS